MDKLSMKSRFRITLTVLGMVLFFGLIVSAEASPAARKWPARTLKIMVPFAAGGGTDMIGRAAGQEISKFFNDSPVTILNTTGGGGSVGVIQVMNTVADGYTALLFSSSPFTVMPATGSLGYTLDDFEVIATFGSAPLLLAVANNSPFQSIEDLIKYAKENPGKLLVAGAGAGTVHQMNAFQFAEATGIELTYVPYDGAAPVMAALLGGHVDIVMNGTPDVAGQHLSGEVRILAMFNDKRVPFLPDVPTLGELGYPGIGQSFNYGLMLKKGSPQEAIDSLKAACASIVESEEFKKMMSAMYFDVLYLPSEEARAKLISELAVNERIVKELGLGN